MAGLLRVVAVLKVSHKETQGAQEFCLWYLSALITQDACV
jgi:hypothetical protein